MIAVTLTAAAHASDGSRQSRRALSGLWLLTRQLEGDVQGRADDAGADLDPHQLQTGQRAVGHSIGQLDATQEGCQVVGLRVQLN